MACMEILDPERRRDQPVVTLDTLNSQPWCSDTVKEIVSHDLWIKDLIALPFGFFKRVIGSLRRQGMKEKFVSPIILFYANKWLLSKKRQQFWENSGEVKDCYDADEKDLTILQGVLDLLPMGEKASKTIPVGFYFSLLARSIELGLKDESKSKLQNQIAAILHLAQLEDFSDIEMDTMASIFLTNVSFNMESTHTPLTTSSSIVSELWDMYLCRVATDPRMVPKRFMDLIQIVPISSRQNHDHLYKALNTFLQVHPELSQEEKGTVCKYLNCKKLSHEVCVEAVQNELMPLRLIVQALFVQQLSTHQAFKECSDSFRFTHCGEFSGSLLSSRYANSRSQNLVESPYVDGEENRSRPLSLLLQKDSMLQKNDLSKKEYESTSFRIQNLEQELVTLKRSLQLQHISKKSGPVLDDVQRLGPYGLEGRSMSKKRTPIGQVSGCIGSVNFSSQRKYANRLLKIFRRISLFG